MTTLPESILRVDGTRSCVLSVAGFMKIYPLSPLATLAVMLVSSELRGEVTASSPVRTAPVGTEASIPDPISDGTPQPPQPPVEKPDLQIESTQVKQLDVVEPPPMPGLPPVEGTITLKVHTVADPGLPDPPPPLPPLPATDPQVLERLAEMSAKYKETRILFLSATVYDHKRTLLRCYPSGNHGKEISAWSNLDFNHFCGFGTFEAKGADGDVRKYALLMGIGNENTERRQALLATKGIEYDGPEIPALPDDKPAFVIETENPDLEGVTLLEDLHALYRAEGTRMAEACAARQKAYEERKAHLLANPPKPKDVTVHFWKRTKGDENTKEEGDQP